MLSGLRFVLPLITLLSLSCWSTLADADLCVSSGGSNGVIHYQEVTGSFIGFCAASNSGGLLLPEGLIFGPDGNLYVSSAGTSSILRYDGKTGAFINAFVPSGSGGLSFPFGVTFGPDGNLYVASELTRSILRYNGMSGAFIDVFVFGGSGGLIAPWGLVFGPDGNLYVSSVGTMNVLRYDGKTGAFINAFVPSGSGGLVFPHGLAFGPDGNLYVINHVPGQTLLSNQYSVLRYNGLTGAFIDAFVPSDPTRNGGLSFPTFLTFTPTSIQFTAFSAKVDISVASSSFDVNSSFTLGSGGSINPLTQDVTVQLGGFTTKIPAGSFRQQNTGDFVFQGGVNGVAFEAKISPLGGGSYSFKIEGAGAPNLPSANPMTVTLTIGNNTGSISVIANIQ